jgi:hypothetical protein
MTTQGTNPMTTTVSQEAREADELLEALSDEADLCRNDGASDIANLLDEARKWIARHRQQAERGEVVAWMYVRGAHRVVVPLSERASHMTEHGWTETPLYTLTRQALKETPDAG